MQIEAMCLDAHLARHLSRGAPPIIGSVKTLPAIVDLGNGLDAMFLDNTQKPKRRAARLSLAAFPIGHQIF